jgi:hypothetical protein
MPKDEKLLESGWIGCNLKLKIPFEKINIIAKELKFGDIYNIDYSNKYRKSHFTIKGQILPKVVIECNYYTIPEECF